ncbi:MAG TPA: type II toxin-antitoxin system PemK/MazF family toxin [Pyrinomonadaceae bacterium]|nr:type II toxin-antitoxin system PemK/MazF family toxin [Pyrinomonadaceae bacterium]
MKNSIVLVPFPYDDLSASKVRPAICLTDEIKPYGHVVLAFITSNISQMPSSSDLVLNESDFDFVDTGLKVSSTIRLHRLLTISSSTIQRKLGELSETRQGVLKEKLRNLFNI